MGPQGCGKGTVWDILERMLGPRAWFSTIKPDRDVVGHFNGRMKDAFFVRMGECNKKKFEHVIGELRAVFTDGTIEVNEKFCSVVNVKSYARFGIDTNFEDAIPDEHGERRYFVVKCPDEKTGHPDDYFTPLHDEVIADDRVIRAFYEFLLARKIKPTYHGKDIPVGAYQRALKDANRPESERFLEWLIEQENMDVKKLHLPNYAFSERYKAFKGEEAQDRSTDGIMKQLKLTDIPGVDSTERARPQNMSWCTGEDRGPGVVHFGARCSFCAEGIPQQEDNKVMRRTTLDCVELRKRFSINDGNAPTEQQPAAAAAAEIDCKADVEAFCAGGQGGDEESDEDDEDDEDDELEHEALGRSMHARGEGPPSPHPSNERVRRGYDQAAAAVRAAGAPGSSRDHGT